MGMSRKPDQKAALTDAIARLRVEMQATDVWDAPDDKKPNIEAFKTKLNTLFDNINTELKTLLIQRSLENPSQNIADFKPYIQGMDVIFDAFDKLKTQISQWDNLNLDTDDKKVEREERNNTIGNALDTTIKSINALKDVAEKFAKDAAEVKGLDDAKKQAIKDALKKDYIDKLNDLLDRQLIAEMNAITSAREYARTSGQNPQLAGKHFSAIDEVASGPVALGDPSTPIVENKTYQVNGVETLFSTHSAGSDGIIPVTYVSKAWTAAGRLEEATLALTAYFQANPTASFAKITKVPSKEVLKSLIKAAEALGKKIELSPSVTLQYHKEIKGWGLAGTLRETARKKEYDDEIKNLKAQNQQVDAKLTSHTPTFGPVATPIPGAAAASGGTPPPAGASASTSSAAGAKPADSKHSGAGSGAARKDATEDADLEARLKALGDPDKATQDELNKLEAEHLAKENKEADDLLEARLAALQLPDDDKLANTTARASDAKDDKELKTATSTSTSAKPKIDTEATPEKPKGKLAAAASWAASTWLGKRVTDGATWVANTETAQKIAGATRSAVTSARELVRGTTDLYPKEDEQTIRRDAQKTAQWAADQLAKDEMRNRVLAQKEKEKNAATASHSATVASPASPTNASAAGASATPPPKSKSDTRPRADSQTEEDITKIKSDSRAPYRTPISPPASPKGSETKTEAEIFTTPPLPQGSELKRDTGRTQQSTATASPAAHNSGLGLEPSNQDPPKIVGEHKGISQERHTSSVIGPSASTTASPSPASSPSNTGQSASPPPQMVSGAAEAASVFGASSSGGESKIVKSKGVIATAFASQEDRRAQVDQVLTFSSSASPQPRHNPGVTQSDQGPSRTTPIPVPPRNRANTSLGADRARRSAGYVDPDAPAVAASPSPTRPAVAQQQPQVGTPNRPVRFNSGNPMAAAPSNQPRNVRPISPEPAITNERVGTREVHGHMGERDFGNEPHPKVLAGKTVVQSPRDKNGGVGTPPSPTSRATSQPEVKKEVKSDAEPKPQTPSPSRRSNS